MIAVGLGLIGVVVGLIVTATPFSLFTFIGLISLAGIIVNNNIVLVDYINQLRERGLGRREAVIEAGATRLRPVVLTALTTILVTRPRQMAIPVADTTRPRNRAVPAERCFPSCIENPSPTNPPAMRRTRATVPR